MNVVYQSPTIDALAHTIMNALQDTHGGDMVGATPSSTDLVRLAVEHSVSISKRSSQLLRRDVDKMVVLVTGTTGGFGSDILEQLLLDDHVSAVYALNRKASSALERQTARFCERGLDVSLLASPKLKMVEGDLSVPGFDIAPDMLEEVCLTCSDCYGSQAEWPSFHQVQQSVTHILHNGICVNLLL